MAVATRTRRERVRVYRFEVRLVSHWNKWDPEPVETFDGARFVTEVRRSPSGFARYRETMKHNGFLLHRVRVVRSGAAA